MTQSAGMANGLGAGELFQILRDGRARTRAELVAQTGLARSTIAARVDALLATGLVATVAGAASTGGRPPARVAMDPLARVVIGADFGASHATVAVADLCGEVLTETFVRRSIGEGPGASLDWLVETVTSLLSALGRPVADVIAVGVGLPGPVEHSTGRPVSPPIMPGWDGYDVPGHVSRTFSVPVLVDNDVNVMALGEQAKGWPDVENLMFIKVATGVGAGIISGGVLHRGADGSAGDVGHIAVPSGAGVLCRCGNEGCLEAVAGVPAILTRLVAEGVAASSLDDLTRLVASGDPITTRVLLDTGRSIGELATMSISLLNPSHIVLGGEVAKFNEFIIAGIRQTVYARPMPLATKHLTIAESRAGGQAGVMGAAILALAHVLSIEYLGGIVQKYLPPAGEPPQPPRGRAPGVAR